MKEHGGKRALLKRQVHLTLSAVSPPSLLKLTAPVAAPAHAAAADFAALLGSLHTDAAPGTETNKDVKKEVKKKDSGPKSEEHNEDSTPAPVATPSPAKEEVLPLTLALPTPIAPPTNAESTPSTEERPEQMMLQKPANSAPEPLPISFPPTLPITLPVTLAALPPTPHIQIKTKAAANSDAEPLATLKLPLEDTPQETPRSELAFEARLTPAPSKQPILPSSTPQAVAPLQPEAPRDEPKPANKLPVPEIKAAETATPATHTAAPHLADVPTKPIETPTLAVPATHIERSADASRAAETTAPSTASASDLPDLPAPRTEPARDISFRIASATNDAVDVKLVDRAGQIHVAVRSSDPALTQSLQANVNDLAGKLERAGFQAETLIPNRASPVHQPQQNSAFQDSQQDRRAPQQDFQPRRKRAAAPSTTFTLNPHQENS